ncbi:MAG: hypothetical protein K6B72_05395 [Lachnospiraceae bacterium]|nr:hypothetical protein [Lachnospiraceae bacterium]
MECEKRADAWYPDEMRRNTGFIWNRQDRGTSDAPMKMKEMSFHRENRKKGLVQYRKEERRKDEK